MKNPARLLLAALLGGTVLTAAIPAFSQSSTPPQPPVTAQSAEEPEAGEDEGWGWRRHGGQHQGQHQGEQHAEGGGEGHGMGHGMHHKMGQGMDHEMGEGRGKQRGRMMMIDANADGVISADEAASMAEGMFLRHDQNSDDVLDEAEFTSPPGRGWGKGWFGWGADEAEAVQKVRKEKFALLDTNKDGKLSKAEFFAEVQQKLASADTDKDGKVTPWEFRALPRM
jgi:Ca2+-binding EF-hand superfamily protein